MAFPTTGIITNFTTADAAPMTGWTDVYNGISAAGGVGVGTDTGDDNASRLNSTYGADTEGYVTITTKPPTSSTVTIFVRSDSAGEDGYIIAARTQSGTDTIELYRSDGLAYTALGASVSQELSVGDAIGIEVIGTSNNIKIYHKPSGGSWGQIGTTQSDGTYTTAGYIVLEVDRTAQVDDFGGGTVVVGGSSIVPILLHQYRARRQ